MEKIALSFTLVWLRLGLLMAQPYAVDASLQLQAPVTPYLEELTQATPSPLQLTLILTDDNEQAYPVRLRFSITGQGISIRTRTDIVPPPILLDYGLPVQLMGSDLIDYFLPEHLEFQGISHTQFIQNGGRLPEGIYNICVEVLDYQRFQGAPISNQSCRLVEMAELAPPQIISPLGEQGGNPIQNLLFQWVPQHIGNFPTSYTLRVWEMRPGLAPNQIVQQTLPIFEHQQSGSTSFLYSLDAPPLEAGLSYLVQVQVEDLLAQHQFTNNGKSEFVQFTYGTASGTTTSAISDDPCLLNLQVQKPTAPNFTLRWGSLPGIETYVLKIAQDSLFQTLLSGFEALSTSDTLFALSGLPEDRTVYIQVEALSNSCPPITAEPISLFLGKGCRPLPADAELAYACGTATDPTSLSASSNLMQELQIEDTIRAHDFHVIVQEISGRERFSGEGYVSVPYLEQAKVNVKFSGIQVDEYCQLISGKMTVTGTGIAVISEDLAATLDSIIGALEILDAGLAEVESVLEDAADFLAELEDIEDYLANGQHVLENLLHLEEHFPYLPPDAIKAFQDALDCLKAAQSASDFEACKTQILSAIDKLKEAMQALYDADYRVNFAALNPPQFGFDTIRHAAQAELYNKIPIADTDYWVPWQSIPSQGTAQVQAIAPSQSPFPENIQFRNEHKQDLSHTESALPQLGLLQLQGKGDQQTETVYALQPYQDSLEQEQIHIAGQLSVISYDPTPLKVQLVPVNGTQYPHDIDNLKKRLQEIFSQAIVEVELSVHDGLQVSEFDNRMDSVPSGFLANYTEEMQLIRNRFKANNTIQDDTYYLFLVEDSEHPQKLGYMPQKKPFGFIYHNNQGSEQQYIKTIAHELAHGAFRLDHSFDDFPSPAPGETDNLMDYTLGTHLQKYQWDLIHNPAANWTLFDGDEEGEYVTATKKLIEKLEEYATDGHLYFLNNLGQVVGLPLDSLQEIVFATGGEMYQTTNSLVPIGTLTFFRTPSGVQYRNCQNGQYYNDQRTNQCVGETYNFTNSLPENIRPLVIRPCNWQGETALQIVAIDNYTPPTASNLSYDFTLPYFYSPELIARGKIWHVTISDGSYYSLSDEFQKQAYSDFIQNHPELAEYDQISSFYLPGLAYLMGRLPGFYESCVNVSGINPFAKLLKPISIDKHDVNAFSQLKKVSDLAKRINALPNPDESVQQLYINLLGGLLASEFFDAYYDSDQEVYNVFDFLINRKNLVDAYQRQIDKLEDGSETDIFDFKQLFQFTDTQLYPCEFEQLNISYATVKQLLVIALETDYNDPPASFGYPIYQEHVVLKINDEDFISKLLSKVESPNCADFLHYLEHTKLENGKALLLEILEEIPSSYVGVFQNSDFANIFKEINRIYNCAIQEPANSYADAYEEMLQAFRDADQQEQIYFNADKMAKAVSYVVPYNYQYLLNRILTLATPYPELMALTDVELNEEPLALEIKQETIVHGIINASRENTKRFLPFSPVILDKSSTYGVANDFLKENKLRLCPAIVFHYFNETAITQTTGDGVFTALDLVTLPLPIPTKINAVGRTLAHLDKASSAISIAATLGQGTEALPNSVKQILNLTSAALGIATLSSEAANSLANWQKARQVAETGTLPIEALHKAQLSHFEINGDIDPFSDLVNTINGTSSSSIRKLPMETRVAIADMIKSHGRKFEDFINSSTKDRVVVKLLQGIPQNLIKLPWTEVKQLLNNLPEEDWISLLDRLENQGKIYLRQGIDGNGYNLYYRQADASLEDAWIATIGNNGNVSIKDNIADEVFDATEMAEVTSERALYCRGGTCEIVNGACFVAGTLVHTAEGFVPIENIEVEDKVWAYHPEKNQPILSKVLHRFKKTWHRFCQIITPGDTLLATNKHPFYVPDLQRYIPADSLRQGMQVLSLAGTILTVQAATTIDTVATVYNFEVADQHNYYVGKHGVLVHNDYWSCHFKGVGINQGLLLEAGIVDDETLKIFEKDILASSKLRKFLKQASEKDDLVLRVKIWDLLKDLPKIRVNFNILSGIAKNSYLFTFFKNNPSEVNSFFDIYSAAWQYYDLLSLPHQGRMNDLRARFFAEVIDNQSYLKFKTHFTVSRDSEYFRGIIRQSLNDNEIMKTRNLAWGNISYRDPSTDLIENIQFIAISGKPATTALMEQGIENLEGNILIPNPPRRNHPERMVKDYIDEVQNRSQDSEVSILDYFMRKLLDETGFDWRKPSDRISILTEFEISLELKSTMSPCLESCHRLLEDDFSGLGIQKNIEFGTRHNH